VLDQGWTNIVKSDRHAHKSPGLELRQKRASGVLKILEE
jgi:hypothetical protein